MEIGRVIGDKLAFALRTAGISHAELAAKAGLSQPAVSSLLRGATKDPPIGSVLRVALALGLKIEDLIAGEITELTALSFVGRDEFVLLSREVAWLRSELAAVNERLAAVAGHVMLAEAADEKANLATESRRVRTGRRPS